MRYQQQKQNHELRNRTDNNVNMSSDMCVFITPLFNLSGGSKLDCSVSGFSHIITTGTTIPLVFDFTGNTSSLSETNASFKFEIYKYNEAASSFIFPSVYKSEPISYQTFSGTNTLNQYIPINDLKLDGEYIVKGFYEFGVCTSFLNKLGKKIDTSIYLTGNEYGIYDNSLDYYFIAMESAKKPLLVNNTSNVLPKGLLVQQILLPENIANQTSNGDFLTGNNMFTIEANYAGNFIITMNGMTLARDEDYTFSGTLVSLNSDIKESDIISVIYTTSGGIGLANDIIKIDNRIISGTTDNQGLNQYYFNIISGKYEIFTSIEPNSPDSILVMINGATLAGEIDFYQSKTNKKRIILEGDLQIGDIVNIAYFPITSVVNGIVISNPLVNWKIDSTPSNLNGSFTLEMASDSNFNTIIYTAATQYQIDVLGYSAYLEVTGKTGTQLYYRIKNEKFYKTISNDIINSVEYSDIVPISITKNSINTY